jgi:glycine/D-amino acid oxidase-like deaminating enzyme
VVGGGITGALAGFHLAEAGVSTVLIDRRDIGTGSTSGSTGLLQYEVDTPLRRLIHQVGKKVANRSYNLCLEALHKLGALANRLHIECNFEKRPSLQLARYKKEIAELQEEFALRRELGISLQFWDETDMRKHFPFSRPAALFSDDAGQVDPHQLTHGLLAAAGKRGLRAFDRTRVLRMEHNRRGIVLRIDGGFTIRARRAVIATGYESKQFLRTNAGALKSTYAIVSEPIEEFRPWYRESLIWETGLPYLYLRTLPDRRIVVGGEDEDFANAHRRDTLISRKTQVLVRKFGKLFPDTKLNVAFAWAGTFGETKDGLPYIGKHRSQPHAYYALGYGGNGITYSLLAAELIRDDFLGRRNRDAALFKFER